jgi:hypothetical protein
MHHRPNNLRLGQILIHLDIATSKEIIEARLKQMRGESSKLIGKILIELDYVTEDDLNRALSLQKDIDMNVYR